MQVLNASGVTPSCKITEIISLANTQLCWIKRQRQSLVQAVHLVDAGNIDCSGELTGDQTPL